MNKFVLPAVAVPAALMLTSFAFADAYVSRHYRTDGAYVGPYFRTNSDGTVAGDSSAKKNINPPEKGKEIRRMPGGTESTKYGKVFGIDGSIKYTYALISSK
jgi:hypothetical protein